MRVEARSVVARLGGAERVREVSTCFEPGTFTALVGPNGAGKTTLLRLLSGEVAPSAGQVLLADRPVGSYAPDALARVRAVLPQTSRLAFGFTVEQIVALGRMPHREPAARTQRHTLEALDAVGMQDFARRRWTTLSGGERQRVQLARVLCQLAGLERGVLFLDEPTNHLDLSHQLATLAIAAERARAGMTVIAVLHDLALTARVADQVRVLAAGRLVGEGRPADVLSPAAVAEVFGVRVRWVDDDTLGRVLVPELTVRGVA